MCLQYKNVEVLYLSHNHRYVKKLEKRIGHSAVHDVPSFVLYNEILSKFAFDCVTNYVYFAGWLIFPIRNCSSYIYDVPLVPLLFISSGNTLDETRRSNLHFFKAFLRFCDEKNGFVHILFTMTARAGGKSYVIVKDVILESTENDYFVVLDQVLWLKLPEF